MTLSLQSRVLALAGLGVFGAGAALSMLSRQSLLAIESGAAREQARAATLAAHIVRRDVLADLEALQSAATAPRVQAHENDARARDAALTFALQQFRLADAVCFTDAAGLPTRCMPRDALRRFTNARFIAAARAAIDTRQPQFSPFVSRDYGEEAAAVVPMPDGSGAASGIVNSAGTRVKALLPSSAGMTLSSRDTPPGSIPSGMRELDVAIDGTSWTLRTVAAPSGEIATFRRRSLWLAPSMSALAVIMAWAVVLSVQRPVKALTGAAERIAAGDLSQPIAGGEDEIGRLAAALDYMRQQLRQSMEQAERANAVLEQRVRQRTAQLARVLRTVISAQEDERRRVARELHDETSQLVAAMAMTIDAAAGSQAPPNLIELRSLVDRMHDGLHRVIVNLRPAVLDDLGLSEAIEWLADHHLRAAGIVVRCELGDLQDCRADATIEVAVFRVVQESIANIVRHAQASSVLIQGGLASPRGGAGAHLWIEIEDDGRGFEPGDIRADSATLRGIGLMGMRERMELIGGTLQIDSAPGQGTHLRLDAPLRLEDEGVRP